MSLLRSGLVLFISMTVVATLALLGLIYWSGLVTPDWRPRFVIDLMPVALICIVTLPTSILLTVFAWRGRRRPVTDGLSLVAAICVLLVLVPGGTSEWGSNFATMVKAAYCGFGLACIVPAHLITYYALRRTPLLRGLVPQKVELKAWLDQRP